MVEGTPPGDALPPPPQRATPARKGARCGAGAGCPHQGHTGHGTLAARSRGWAAGGGTAPDTRRPSQLWQATPPGDGCPPPPRHAAPTGHAGQGDSVGPPHPHTRAHSTWVADPNSPPSGRAVGGGTAPDFRRPSQWWRAPPWGTPFRHPHSEQRRPARAHAVGPMLGPHARTDRTRDTRVTEPWLPAPEDGQLGEGQRLTPDAPHNGGRPSPAGTAPNRPRGTQAPQGMQARGTVLGPHSHTPAPTARGWRTPTARPVGGQSGEGQRLTSDPPHTMVEGTPPGDALPPPPQRATPARKGARCGTGAGSPRPHRPHPGHEGRGILAARSRGRAAGGGTAPDTRHPSQWWKAPPPGTPFRQPHSEQRRPVRAHAVGPVLGPQARTDRTRDTRVADPWLPAPEDGGPGEGQRVTPDAPQNGGRATPPGTVPHHPRGTQPLQGTQARGTVLGPQSHTPAPTARGWRTPTARPVGGQSGEGQRLTSDAPHTMVEGSPPGDALPPTPQRATPARKGARCGAGAGSPSPHRPHPGHTGRRTPAARPRGRAAWRGTAPDTRRPSQRWQADPPGDGPPPPLRQAAPIGHTGQGDGVGPPHPHTRDHSMSVTDPNRPPSGRAVQGGGAPDDRRPSQRWKAPPRERPSATPTASNAGPQGRTLWGRCWVPTPGPAAPGTHGSRNPGCPPQRAGGRGRDSA